MIHPTIFKQFPEVVCGFSDKSDGNMGLNNAKIKDQNAKLQLKAQNLVYRNREAFLGKLDIDVSNLVLPKQTHGDNVELAVFDHLGLAQDNASPFSSADGLVTREPNIYLATFSADCLPIFFYEPKKHIIAAVHAGWRGIAKNIISQTIEKIISLGGLPEQLIVWIGPHIKKCHYTIIPQSDSYQEKIDIFSKIPHSIVENNGQAYLDLTGVAVRQLGEQGVVSGNIEIGPCTVCNTNKYYSYHLERGNHGGIMMGAIGIQPT